MMNTRKAGIQFHKIENHVVQSAVSRNRRKRLRSNHTDDDDNGTLNTPPSFEYEKENDQLLYGTKDHFFNDDHNPDTELETSFLGCLELKRVQNSEVIDFENNEFNVENVRSVKFKENQNVNMLEDSHHKRFPFKDMVAQNECVKSNCRRTRRKSPRINQVPCVVNAVIPKKAKLKQKKSNAAKQKFREYKTNSNGGRQIQTEASDHPKIKNDFHALKDITNCDVINVENKKGNGNRFRQLSKKPIDCLMIDSDCSDDEQYKEVDLDVVTGHQNTPNFEFQNDEYRENNVHDENITAAVEKNFTLKVKAVDPITDSKKNGKDSLILENDQHSNSFSFKLLESVTNHESPYPVVNSTACLAEKNINAETPFDDSEKTVFHFRDINKRLIFNSGGGQVKEEGKETSLIESLTGKTTGRKRRYAKLMKKLEDTGKSIESNIKTVMDGDNKTMDKDEVTTTVDSIKKKLCVREKKKYESLINYQRCQANVEQKCFEILLPEKAKAVTANIVKQLGDDNKYDSKTKEKKCKRGRPAKNTKSVGKKNKTKAKKLGKLNKASKKSSNSSEKIRLGIIHKNGMKEVIELSNETMKGMDVNAKVKVDENVVKRNESNKSSSDVPPDRNTSERSATNNSRIFETREDRQSVIITLNEKKDSADLNSTNPIPLTATAPPTTIQLPLVSSLELEYKLISISYIHDGKIGDFKTDQFFIPQATFNKGGQIGMVIVGPFCVKYDPKPHIMLVPPKDHKKDIPMMILTKNSDFSPDNPPLNSSSIGVTTVVPTNTLSLITLDHNYCSPATMQESVKRFVKGLAKHNANARFIDAKVQSIQEEDGNSLVTISGDNIFKKVKDIRQHPAAIPVTSTKDGIPVVYNLTQIMTPVLKRSEQRAKREEMAQQSKETGDFTHVFVPYENMGEVAYEIIVPPCGTEMMPACRSGKSSTRPIGKSNSSEFEEMSSNAKPTGFTTLYDNDYNNGESYLTSSAMTSGNNSNNGNLSPSGKWNFVVSESDTGGHIICYSSTEQDMVPIENAAEVDSNTQPGLSCCRLCLRLFPNAYSLFSHVRSSHMTEDYSSDSGPYLKELRARSRVSCPVCGPAISYCTSLKLKKHLQTFHSMDEFSLKDSMPQTSLVFSTTCTFCLMEFPTAQDLSLHMQRSHSVNTNSMMQQGPNGDRSDGGGNFFSGGRSRLSDCLTCSRCNIIFDDRNSLVSHTLNLHPDLNQSNTICRLCEREFDTESLLMKHLRNSHKRTESGAIRCLYCPAWLANLDEASIHKMSVHSGDVPVHCPFCGAGYQSMHSMYNHVRNQHLQTETLMCPECQLMFASARLLTEHARKRHCMSAKIIKEYVKTVRSGNYCCPFCTVSFTRTYDLAMHVVLLHKDPLLPAKCHFCMQCFVNDMILKMHMAGAHGVIVEQSNQPIRNQQEVSFLHHSQRYLRQGEDHTIVLDGGEEEEEEEDYHIPEGFAIANKEVMTSMEHSLMIESGDIISTQGMESYMEEYGTEQPREATVYVDERNQVINIQNVQSAISTRDKCNIFDAVSTLEQVHLLGDSTVRYNLQGADYLETLTNDHVAVAEDVVADVCIEDIVHGNEAHMENTGHTIHTTEDMLSQSLEVDGVLYQLTMGPEQHNQPIEISLKNNPHQMNIPSQDLTHLL